MKKNLDDWLDYQENLHTKTIDLGLERIGKVYKRLFPQTLNFKVITVAGTNGKGSTITLIESIYQQANIQIAKFTSPHLLQYNERFVVNGVQASDEQICSAFEKIEQQRKEVSLTYFEFSTLAALIIFTAADVDIVLLEVGLGGRLDSVNVVDCDMAIISNIDIDHTDYLGDTREAIALEKSGIMRKNTPCICGDSNPPSTIAQHAKKIGALLTFTNTPYSGAIRLQGEHQKYNATLAVAMVNSWQSVFPVSQTQLANGIQNATLSGRFQLKTINNKTIVLDVAHNPAAVQSLCATLNSSKQPTVAIFSALKDKNINSMIEIIEPIINEWLLVPIHTNRAITMQDLTKKFDLASDIKVCKDVSFAIHQALNAKQHQRIVIFGSFYIVADALKIFDKIL
ncbi:Dihydrofolate synthase @ Folylpolyglutamate synthase [uncultured Candidatus Thioglobus sp.]|nr:Dihydrofolate synthase @ Folylpolyglutamate synthase [uncultured Candidatus Thioglobus sp.]